MGRSQVVRQRVLNPSCEGSNPSAPANLKKKQIFYFAVKIPALSKKSDFKQLSTHGKKIYKPFCTIVYLKNDNLNLRLSFAASRRIGNAVIRNKIRRRLRAAMSQVLSETKCDVDMLIIPKTNSVDYDFKKVTSEFKKIIAQI